MTADELREVLQRDGWRIERDGYAWKRTGVDWWAYRIFDGFTDCICNQKPPHVAVIPWDLSNAERTHRSVQITVTGEIQNGRWITLEVYSVPMDEAFGALPQTVNALRAAWNAAAQVQAEAQ